MISKSFEVKFNFFVARIILILLIITLSAPTLSVYAYSADPIEIFAPAKAMVVLEGNTNTVLYEFNKDVQLPMASVTKITTAILAIEECDDLNEIITVSDKAVGVEGTSIYLNKDEQISVKDLLLGLILASGNDCAVALAEHFGGLEVFVEKMNNFAKKIGAVNTHYDNPHGLDSETHYTTAYDLALITSYALKNEIFRDVSTTKYATIEKTNNHEKRYLKNKNKLLFKMENCIGVKTGFTDNAGRCLVNAHEENDMQIISVVLSCGPMFEECERLTKKALDEYEMVTFVKPYNYISDVIVESGEVNNIGIANVRGYKVPVLKSEKESYEVKYDFPNSVVAPIELNSVIGKVFVLKNGEIVFEENIYTIEETRNIDIKHILNNIISKFQISN